MSADQGCFCPELDQKTSHGSLEFSKVLLLSLEWGHCLNTAMPPAVPQFKNEILHGHEKNRTEPLKNDLITNTGQAVRLMQAVKNKEQNVIWLSRSKGCTSDCSMELDR